MKLGMEERAVIVEHRLKRAYETLEEAKNLGILNTGTVLQIVCITPVIMQLVRC